MQWEHDNPRTAEYFALVRSLTRLCGQKVYLKPGRASFSSQHHILPGSEVTPSGQIAAGPAGLGRAFSWALCWGCAPGVLRDHSHPCRARLGEAGHLARWDTSPCLYFINWKHQLLTANPCLCCPWKCSSPLHPCSADASAFPECWQRVRERGFVVGSVLCFVRQRHQLNPFE